MNVYTSYLTLPVGAAFTLAFISLSADFAHAQGIQAENVLEDENVLEEIIVSSRRRDESLQDVPIAITAFSAQVLQEARIDNIQDIALRTPGLTYNNFSIGLPEIFIRGVGSTIEDPAADNSVAVFVDDVYISRGSGATVDLFDLERVEVLRGPQGTLFGKNVAGGAIRFITKRPSNEYGASALFGTGHNSLIEAKASVTGPISDGLLGRLSFSSRSHDGFAKNTFTGNNMDTEDTQGLRGMLEFNGRDNFRALLSADYIKLRASANYRNMDPVGGSNTAFAQSDPRKGPKPIDGQGDSDIGGASLTLTWEGDWGTVNSITSFRSLSFLTYEETSGGFIDPAIPIVSGDPNLNQPDLGFIQTYDETSDTVTQELRITSPSDDRRVSWLAGVYYLHQETDQTLVVDYTFPRFGGVTGTTDTEGLVEVDSYAVYGQVNYKLSDSWDVSLGARWSEDEKAKITSRGGRPYTGPYLTPGGLGFTTQASESWSNVTPSLDFRYRFENNTMAYVSARKGYKSGGFQGKAVRSPEAANTPFDEEEAWNYEVGLKGEFFNRKLSLNVAAFRVDYTDMQTEQLIEVSPGAPLETVVANAGRSQVDGFELEYVLAPTQNLQLIGSYGYLDAKITSDLIINNVNQKGFGLRRAPENTASLLLRHQAELSNGNFLRTRVEYAWSDEYPFENNNSPITQIDSAGTLDASFTWGRDVWELKIWGKNLTDELDIRTITDVFGTGHTMYKPPRTYGVSVLWQYK